MKRAGFTLLEILIATVIGSFVALTALGTLRAITASREKIDTYQLLAGQLRYAAQTMRKDLANLYRDKDPQYVKLVGSQEETGTGTFSRLLVHSVNWSNARAQQPEGDVYEVEYYLQQKEDRFGLMRRRQPNPPAEQDSPGGILAMTAEHIVAFEIRYYDGAQWLLDWPEEQTTLPTLVNVRLVAKEPEHKQVLEYSFLVDFPRWPKK